MVDIQSATAEIRRGKKERKKTKKKKKPQDENIGPMPASAMQGGHKELKLGLVASYDIWPWNEKGLFLFQCAINLSLTYLLRHLPTNLHHRDPHRAGRMFEYIFEVRMCMCSTQ